MLTSTGIASDRILAETKSFDSTTNWKAAMNLIRERGFQKVVLVSDPLHMLRLRAIAEKNAHNLSIRYAPYRLNTVKPSISPATVYWYVHHEWIAVATGMILPEDTYRSLISFFRQN